MIISRLVNLSRRLRKPLFLTLLLSSALALQSCGGGGGGGGTPAPDHHPTNYNIHADFVKGSTLSNEQTEPTHTMTLQFQGCDQPHHAITLSNSKQDFAFKTSESCILTLTLNHTTGPAHSVKVHIDKHKHITDYEGTLKSELDKTESYLYQEQVTIPKDHKSISIHETHSTPPATEGYYTKNGEIYESQGAGKPPIQVQIDGIAWNGFQDAGTLESLYGNSIEELNTSENKFPGLINLLTNPWTVPGSGVTSQEHGVAFKTIRLPIEAGVLDPATDPNPPWYKDDSTNSFMTPGSLTVMDQVNMSGASVTKVTSAVLVSGCFPQSGDQKNTACTSISKPAMPSCFKTQPTSSIAPIFGVDSSITQGVPVTAENYGVKPCTLNFWVGAKDSKTLGQYAEPVAISFDSSGQPDEASLKNAEKVWKQASGVHVQALYSKGILTFTPAPDWPFMENAIDPSNLLAGNGPLCDWDKGDQQKAGWTACYPKNSVAKLLDSALKTFNRHNLRVMIDIHHPPGFADSLRTGNLVQDGYTLQKYYKGLSNFSKHLKDEGYDNVMGIDIFNEPYNLFWYQKNGDQPAWINVIAAAATAVYKNNPGLLVMVEGPASSNDPADPIVNKPTSTHHGIFVDCTGFPGENYTSQQPAALQTGACGEFNAGHAIVRTIGSNYGENFRALIKDDAPITTAVFDVKSFRTKLIDAIIQNGSDFTAPVTGTEANQIADWLLGKDGKGTNGHLVFLPHLYGSKIASWQTSNILEATFRFDWNFGFLKNAGFPVLIGELGFDLKEPASGGEDFFLNSVAPYLESHDMQHDLFYWTFQNGDDPAGLLPQDPKKSTVVPWKEQDLHDLFYYKKSHSKIVGK